MKKYLLILLLLLAMIACKNEPTARESQPYQVSVNPGSPLLLRINGKNGAHIDYMGKKDANGLVTSVDLVAIYDGIDSLPLLMSMEDSKPVLAIAPNGAQMQLHWEDSKNVRIVATASNGQIQLSIPFDLSQPPGGRVAGKPSPMRKGDVSISVKPIQAVASGSRTMGGTLNVSVEKCGKPFTGESMVYLNITDENGKPQWMRKAVTSGGVANLDIPSPGEKVKLSDICNSLASAINFSCDYITPITKAYQVHICATLAAATDVVIFGPTGESIPLFAGCEAFLNGFHTYCELTGSPYDGVPSLADGICSASEALDEKDAKLYNMKAFVYAPGEEASSSELYGPINATGPYPSNMKVTLPGGTKIEDFLTFPIDPEAHQGYNAKANVYCLPANTQVTMSVVGTDGYTKTRTFTVSGDSELSMYVPGSYAGVEDRLKIVIGDKIMYAAIVF